MRKSLESLIRRNSARWVALGGVVTALLHAQAATADDAASAQALFDQGLADMLAGRYETGCPNLANAYRMDPRPGVLFTLAECEADRGHVATAVAHYSDYLARFAQMTPEQRSKEFDRNEIAAKRRAALDPQIPVLTLVLSESAPKGTVVKRDGVKLDPASLKFGLRVDPGEHVVTTQAPGGAVTELRVSLALGERAAITLEVKGPMRPPLPLPLPVLYDDGDPIPPGYTVQRRSDRARLVVGSILFVIPYVLSALVAGTAVNATSAPTATNPDTPTGTQFAPLFIPCVGPFVTIGTTHTSDERMTVVYVLDGLLQTGGVVIFVSGLAFGEKFLQRTSQSPPKPTEPLHPEVLVGLGSTSLKWRF
jgi:hypothetical protein